MDLKIHIAKAIKQAADIPLSEQQLYDLLEQPKELSHGDYAFPAFSLAKILKQPPQQIAQNLQTTLDINTIPGITKVQVQGPYLNFFRDKSKQAQELIKEILDNTKLFIKPQQQSQTIVIEYPGPNTNKPLHLGHLRNMFLAKSIATLLAFQGNDVKHVNINNDRGVHICKSMLAYKLFGNNQEPDKKSDHFVGDWYVRYAQEAKDNPQLEQDIQNMLELWEKGDPETRALWDKMRKWSLDGFKQTYEEFNIIFDKEYFESDFYDKARDIVTQGQQQGVFKTREDGAILAEFPETKLPEKVVLRSNGTTVYITQDIYLAQLRYQDFNMDAMMYVVGNEQELHFRQLFAILKQLNAPYADNCYHLSYGMVELPTGKMKSREGTSVDVDNILAQTRSMATQSLKERHQLDEQELNHRAHVIADAALKFFILKYNAKDNFMFNPQESLSFDGETGPYVLYTYARIQSLIKDQELSNPSFADLQPVETELINLLQATPTVITDAVHKRTTHLICQHLIKLCKVYNSFYHELPVNKAESQIRQRRVLLSSATAHIIKECLHLLTIDILDEM